MRLGRTVIFVTFARFPDERGPCEENHRRDHVWDSIMGDGWARIGRRTSTTPDQRELTMTIHETRTDLTPAEVMERARAFFSLVGTPHAAFAERAGKGFLKLTMEVGEIVVATLPEGDSTLVRGSASRGTHLLTHFLSSLAAPLDARETVHRPGLHRTHAARVEAQTEAAVLPATQAA